MSVCYGQTPGWIKMPVGTTVGHGLGDIVLHGYPSPKKGNSSAHISAMYGGQSAGWIKVLLGTR